MKVVVVGQRKGGTGKTTVAKTLAEYAAIHRHKRVLALDFDTQCNLSGLYLKMDLTQTGTRPPLNPEYNANDPDQAWWAGRSSSADIYGNGRAMPYTVALPEGSGTLDILPGDSQRLIMIEEQDRTVLKEAVEARLAQWIDNSRADLEHLYDLLIIDTAPSASPLTRSALRAATHLLVPMELEQQCFEGMHEMLTMWRQENKRRRAEERLEILAIQPNKVKLKRLVHQELLGALKSMAGVQQFLSPVLIPDRAEFAERDMKGAKPQSVFQLPPSSDARKVAVKFGDFIFDKLFPQPLKDTDTVQIASRGALHG